MKFLVKPRKNVTGTHCYCADQCDKCDNCYAKCGPKLPCPDKIYNA